MVIRFVPVRLQNFPRLESQQAQLLCNLWTSYTYPSRS